MFSQRRMKELRGGKRICFSGARETNSFRASERYLLLHARRMGHASLNQPTAKLLKKYFSLGIRHRGRRSGQSKRFQGCSAGQSRLYDDF